jgi:phage-related protein (TIGR01555 family)
MVIITTGKSDKPINVDAINEDTPLSFQAADLWELHQTNLPAYGEQKAYVKSGFHEPAFFYYGNKLDETRVLKTRGKRAPSLARPQLRGWGMSEVERLIRSLNQYLKNNDLIFELLDEAKIDVYGIQGFNKSLLTQGGTEKLTKRVQMANKVKNYQQAIVKDKEDDYDQKQMNFAGLSEMLQQIRIGIASDLKMPLTKLFGLSTAGFSSGEDEIENYNSMIESEIRGKFDNLIIQMLKLICQKLFGIVPDDLQIAYKPLRMLSAIEEEQVKTSQENRILAMYDRALMTSDQVIEEMNQSNLFASDLENESRSDFPMPAPAKPKMDIETSKTTNSIINKLFKKNGN